MKSKWKEFFNILNGYNEMCCLCCIYIQIFIYVKTKWVLKKICYFQSWRNYGVTDVHPFKQVIFRNQNWKYHILGYDINFFFIKPSLIKFSCMWNKSFTALAAALLSTDLIVLSSSEMQRIIHECSFIFVVGKWTSNGILKFVIIFWLLNCNYNYCTTFANFTFIDNWKLWSLSMLIVLKFFFDLFDRKFFYTFFRITFLCQTNPLSKSCLTME